MKQNHISINVCTYKRNHTLARLLRKLKEQESGGFFSFSIILIDNDPNGMAQEVANRAREELHLEIKYEIEPERSIPAARNRALSLSEGNYIAIIDDDEFPPPHWLITLYRAIQTFEVDGALGPVFPYFEQTPPDWLIKGGFCERPVLRTGTLLKWHQTRTGNVLMKRKVFDEYGLKFDLRWKTSGSDRAFFKEAINLGYRFIAVAEAPVFEIIPPERWKKAYYLKRALVHGYNSYQNSIKGTSLFKEITTALRSALAIIIYILGLPLSLLFGTHWLVKCLEKGGHHLSQLLARLRIQLIKKREF